MVSLLEALAKAACASARKTKAYTDEKISEVNDKFEASAGMLEGLEGYSMRGSASGQEITIDDMRDLPSKVRVKATIGVEEEESLVNLVPFPYKDGNSKYLNGVHFSVNQNGSIDITTDEGGATNTASFYLFQSPNDNLQFVHGEYYTRYHYKYDEDKNVTIEFRYYRDSITSTTYIFLPYTEYGSSVFPSTSTGLHFYVMVKKGTILTEPLTVYPMIVKGNNVPISKYVSPNGAGSSSPDVTITTSSTEDPSIIGETITTQIGETVELSPITPAMKISSNREDVNLKVSYNRKFEKVIEKITDAFIRLGGKV